MAPEDMELKEVILSTLAEMEHATHTSSKTERLAETPDVSQKISTQKIEPVEQRSSSDEMLFLESVRERLLVLFEGFQSPNNTQIEAKVDLTLNFLEYLLSTIDARLDKIK